jgi:integrase
VLQEGRSVPLSIYVRERPVHLRARDSRVRRLVLLGATSRVQPDRRSPLFGSTSSNVITRPLRRLLEHSTPSTPRDLRDHAMVAMLIGCGLRWAELLALTLESVQQREEHWVIADLLGKGGHVRTVPIPGWVKDAVDAWTHAVDLTHGPVFRAINKAGRVWGAGMSPKVLWDVVRAAADKIAMRGQRPFFTPGEGPRHHKDEEP